MLASGDEVVAKASVAEDRVEGVELSRVPIRQGAVCRVNSLMHFSELCFAHPLTGWWKERVRVRKRCDQGETNFVGNDSQPGEG